MRGDTVTASNSEARKRAEESERRAAKYARWYNSTLEPGAHFYVTEAIYGAWTWSNTFPTADQAWDHLCEVAEENGQAPEHAILRKVFYQDQADR